MPHVQIAGACPVRDLLGPLGAFAEQCPTYIAKVQDVFVDEQQRRLLLDVLVVEGYLRQGFFLLVKEDEQGVLIRCHPSSAVQKTEGVKTLIARLGRRVLELSPGGRIGHTNLQTHLERREP